MILIVVFLTYIGVCYALDCESFLVKKPKKIIYCSDLKKEDELKDIKLRLFKLENPFKFKVNDRVYYEKRYVGCGSVPEKKYAVITQCHYVESCRDGYDMKYTIFDGKEVLWKHECELTKTKK